MNKENFNDYITGTSNWLFLKDIPSSGTSRYTSLSELGKIGVYIVALKEDTLDIDSSNYVNPKIGYVGKSCDIVTRTYNIRATVSSKKQSYHGCGTYIKNRLDKISFDNYCVKFLYCASDENSTKLESEIHRLMFEKFKYRFAWQEASGGKDGRMERIMNDLEILNDDEKLKVYDFLHKKEVPQILLRRYHAELDVEE